MSPAEYTATPDSVRRPSLTLHSATNGAGRLIAVSARARITSAGVAAEGLETGPATLHPSEKTPAAPNKQRHSHSYQDSSQANHYHYQAAAPNMITINSWSTRL